MASEADIEGLMERVKASTGPDREIDADIALAVGWTHEKHQHDRQPYWRVPGETRGFMRTGLPAFTSSLDAIVGLIEREFPEWDYGVMRSWDWHPSAPTMTGDETAAETPHIIVFEATIQRRADCHPAHYSEEILERGASLPLALIAAFLAAKLSQARNDRP